MAEFDQKKFDKLMKDVTYTPVFVPQSHSRNKDEKRRTLNWSITISRGSQSITCDYSMGMGCLSEQDKKMLVKLGGPNPHSVARDELDKEIAETGKVKQGDFGVTFTRVQPPLFRDVMYSLLSDSDAIDYASFESWASDLGYDTDSRKAEAIYQACVKTALGLRAMLGDATITKLRELFQDY